MSWDEFSDLIGGLTEQTSLVRIAQIRTESDPNRLKEFTPEHRAIRNEWQRRRALNKPKEETVAFLSDMEEAFARMFGGNE